MRIKKLIHVSIELALDGGGAALFSRLLARSMADYCAERGLEFEVLHLGRATDILTPIPVTHFYSYQLALAAAVWYRAILGKSPILFDHIGPARSVGILPSFLHPPYALCMLGIEVWSKLTGQRRFALEDADLRLSISSYTERRARLTSPWIPDVKVLHLALEERPPCGSLDMVLLEKLGTDFILIVGRLSGIERYKGHDELLEAMPAILRQIPNARLVIAGKGHDQSRLEAKAKELGITQQVIFTGFVSETTLEKLYERCSVFAMPSKNEGFGLVFLEAMKARKPAVALRDSSVAEIICDGETGLLVDEDVAQITAAIVYILSNPVLAQQMGEAAYIRWRKYFSFESFKAKLSSYLDEWLENLCAYR